MSTQNEAADNKIYYLLVLKAQVHGLETTVSFKADSKLLLILRSKSISKLQVIATRQLNKDFHDYLQS